jgi:DNA-binding LacI/PurR family transcriptional regulator
LSIIEIKKDVKKTDIWLEKHVFMIYYNTSIHFGGFMTGHGGRTSGIPKYLQVRNTLARRIQSGLYRRGDKIPTERELMKELGMSSATVSHALRDMMSDGLIVRRIGCGTFVTNTTPPPERDEFDSGAALLVNDSPGGFSAKTDNLNWFIISEIRRGVTNTFGGATKILPEPELLGEMESSENRRAILINPTPAELLKLERKNIEHILVNQNKVSDPGYNCVSCGQMHGVYEAMSFLIERLGHRLVAMITGGKESHRDRYAAYRISLETYGVPFRENMVQISEDGSESSGYNAMVKLLRLSPRPTAVFADTDIKAAGAIKAASDSGLRVPEDISVLGFDDVPGLGEQLSLTTVRMPYYEMGEAAVRLLRQKIAEKKDRIPSLTLKTSLIIRGSCAEAPKT